MDINNNNLHPQAIFAMAHTDLRLAPFNNHGRTLRMVVPVNVHAQGLQVRFSNHHGDEPLPIAAANLALCSEEGDVFADTFVPLTVDARLAFELPAQGGLLSDVAPLEVKPGDYFALSLYYPSNQRVVSGNWLNNTAFRSRSGNYTTSLQLPGMGLAGRLARTMVNTDFSVAITSVDQIIAHSEQPEAVLGCFGDSITQQSNWTGPLRKLLHHHFPGKISLCNLGISGNRILGNSPPRLGGLNGEAGMLRFERDMLQLPGLTHAILAIGTNDIGLPGSDGLSDDELIEVHHYVEAMQRLAEELHERGVLVYAATLCPRAINKQYTLQREMLRLEMNEWIRSAECFDAVIDFDEALRREDGESGMRDGCSLPDGLHPSPLGGMIMAKHIDLSLFGGDCDG